MKEKLLNTLGIFGGILWFIVSALIYVLPFVMIGASFWVNLLLFGIVYFFPYTSAIFWVWGLVCAIQGPQDVWAIIYYVLFVIAFIPFFVSIITNLLSKIYLARGWKSAKKEVSQADEEPDIWSDPTILVNDREKGNPYLERMNSQWEKQR